jgi:hypothetical protein
VKRWSPCIVGWLENGQEELQYACTVRRGIPPNCNPLPSLTISIRIRISFIFRFLPLPRSSVSCHLSPVSCCCANTLVLSASSASSLGLADGPDGRREERVGPKKSQCESNRGPTHPPSYLLYVCLFLHASPIHVFVSIMLTHSEYLCVHMSLCM